MNKLDLFLAAMAAEEFRRRAWVLSAFSVIREDTDAWKRNAYAYRIVQTPTGAYYVNPDNIAELLPIEGTKAGEPPYTFKERVQVKASQVANLTKASLETNYGNLLFNFVACIWPFRSKVPYQEGRITARGMEALILPRLQDTPKEEELREDKWLYVDEYLKFCDAMFYLAGFTQLLVPGSSPKSMVQPKGMQELRARLLEENKDRLHDPSVVAQIQKQLIAFDKEYLKGDSSTGMLITNKSWNVVRSKQFGMVGAEMKLNESVDVKVIPKSLAEGWSLQHFPDYMNSLRAGSYNRGAQTVLGGESVKWLLRASSNISVTAPDCGSTRGNDFTATRDNADWLVGFSIITPQGPKLVSDQDAASYIGKRVTVRSPMFCKLPKTDYCATCVGQRLAAHPTALSAAIAEQGSAFLDIFMAAAHGKQLTVAKLDFRTAIQ